MKEQKIISALISAYIATLVSCVVMPVQVTQSKSEVQVMTHYNNLSDHYDWMSPRAYIIIMDCSRKYSIDPVFVCSVIQYESGDYCNNDLSKMLTVRSHAGAIGVMQVMPLHFKVIKEAETLKGNINKGCWYLSECMKKSKGNMREAARMYNAGLYSKRWKYRNWKYVNKIIKKYNSVMVKP